MFCRTRGGTLRLVWNGVETLLGTDGADLPDAQAADIRGHVNVIVDEPAVAQESPPRKWSKKADGE